VEKFFRAGEGGKRWVLTGGGYGCAAGRRSLKESCYVIEQEHRFIKKKVRSSQYFKSFHAAGRTLEGIEAVNMMGKVHAPRLATLRHNLLRL
jgi:transposase-like protein